MQDPKALAEQLLDFIDDSPTPWHATASAASWLAQAGFEPLDERDDWALESGKGYYVIRDESSLIAWRMGTRSAVHAGFRVIGAHTDSPGLRLKPNAEHAQQEWLRLGVEVYGGPILATFVDRDLSLAGRVVIRNEAGLETRLVRFEEPMIRIPNLAIHLNRQVNEEGLKLNPQTEMLPILGRSSAPDEPILKRELARRLHVEAEDILAWELGVYDTQPGSLYGLNQEFITDSQLDNLASCHAALAALTSTTACESTQIVALFDHEEVGSGSDKGADGCFLRDVMERIVLSTESGDRRAFYPALARSYMLSADMAHAWHPNFPEKHDPQHRPIINEGPVIKINSNQRYTTDAVTEGLFVDICRTLDIPYQKFINRTDLSCGSTIGPMTAAATGIASLDVGSPQWAMHSIRESAGVLDHEWMVRAMGAFYQR
jgi:aspartyl aminopeptidase